MHLAKLGLQVTRPATYAYQHPDLPRWLKLPASILEQNPPPSLPVDVPDVFKLSAWPPSPRDLQSDIDQARSLIAKLNG
jgi:hypothetical protein